MGDTAQVDLSDLDLGLIYVRSPGSYLFELNPGDVPGTMRTVPPFLPWFRLFKGEDFTAMADYLNNLSVRAYLAARQVAIAGNYSMLLGDYNILATAAPLTVRLPGIEDFIDGGYVGTDIWIKDAGRVATGANRIVTLPAVADVGVTIEGFAQWDIAQAGQSVRFVPDTINRNKWLVK